MIIVFDEEEHPDWGMPGSSTSDPFEYTRQRVNALLGTTNGTYVNAVLLARWRSRASTREASPGSALPRCA